MQSIPSLRATLHQKVSRCQAIASLDSCELVTLLFWHWAVVAGGAKALLLLLWLNPIELGLSQVIIQMVGPEVVHLNYKDGFLCAAPPPVA